MKISGKQIASARELVGLTQGELAVAAGVGLHTVVRFETGQAEPYPVNLEKIRSELERRGVEFLNGDSPPSAGEGIGVRLNISKAAEYTRAEKNSTR